MSEETGKIRIVLDLDLKNIDTFFGGTSSMDAAIVYDLVSTKLPGMSLPGGTITKAEYLQYVVNPAHETVQCDALHPVLAASIYDKPKGPDKSLNYDDLSWLLEHAVLCEKYTGEKAKFILSEYVPKGSFIDWEKHHLPYHKEDSIWKQDTKGYWYHYEKEDLPGWDLDPLFNPEVLKKKSQVYLAPDEVTVPGVPEVDANEIAYNAKENGYHYSISHHTIDKIEWPPAHFPVYRIKFDKFGDLVWTFTGTKYGDLED